MIPIRFLFRSRWAALAWTGSICLSAVNFAGHSRTADDNMVDASTAPDGLGAAASALSAHDAD